MPAQYSSDKTVQKYATVTPIQLSSTAETIVTTSIERQINTFRDKFFFSKSEENINTFKYATYNTKWYELESSVFYGEFF